MNIAAEKKTSLRRLDPAFYGEFVLCLDTGCVLRSQTGRLVCNEYGIPAIAAALGDVSSQHFKGYVPESAVQTLQKYQFRVQKEPIQEVTEEMAWKAGTIVIYDSTFLHRHPFIDPYDPRVHILAVPDVSDFMNPAAYGEAIKATRVATLNFIRVRFPDRYNGGRPLRTRRGQVFANTL